MTIRQIVLCVASAGVLVGGGVEAGQSLDRAQRDYEAAMAESDDGRRIELLKRSYEEYETYEAAIALGETLLGSGEWQEARDWLYEASALGSNDEWRARVLFRLGESYASEGDWVRAVRPLRDAEALHDLPMIRQALRAARRESQGQLVSREAIADTLTDKGVGLSMRIDLHINFEFDSARMTRGGWAQAEELGAAMLSIAYDEGPAEWVLVGHTDEQGARSYNRALSVRRAESVRAYLVDEFGFDPRDIAVEGRGEDELLDGETTEAAHAVNRRVEVARLQ